MVGEFTATTSVGSLLLHVAPSVSCPCVDTRLTRRRKLPPSPAVSGCLPMSTTRLSFLPNHHPKSTIIKLLSKTLWPDEGDVILGSGETVACAMQTMPTHCRDMTVKAFFSEMLGLTHQGPPLEDHEVETKIALALQEVVLEAPTDRIIKSFSGGQQARLLLAAALIQEPSILLLDEPTNNLDHEGLWHLQYMIQMTDKTVVVISHDEDFLNSFTDQVPFPAAPSCAAAAASASAAAAATSAATMPCLALTLLFRRRLPRCRPCCLSRRLPRGHPARTGPLPRHQLEEG